MSYYNLNQLNEYTGNSPWCYSVERAKSFNSDRSPYENFEVGDSNSSSCSKYKGNCGNCDEYTACSFATPDLEKSCMAVISTLGTIAPLPPKTFSGAGKNNYYPCCYLGDLWCHVRDGDWKKTFAPWVSKNIVPRCWPDGGDHLYCPGNSLCDELNGHGCVVPPSPSPTPTPTPTPGPPPPRTCTDLWNSTLKSDDTPCTCAWEVPGISLVCDRWANGAVGLVTKFGSYPSCVPKCD